MVLLFNVWTNDFVLSQKFEDEIRRYGDAKIISKPELFGAEYSILLAFGGSDTRNVIALIENLKNRAKELIDEREKATYNISVLRFNAFKITECYGDFNQDTKEWLMSYINNNC